MIGVEIFPITGMTYKLHFLGIVRSIDMFAKCSAAWVEGIKTGCQWTLYFVRSQTVL
jgi:hypothetical protein